jgi:uncharacterized repeat protein (TIGR03803 family)
MRIGKLGFFGKTALMVTVLALGCLGIGANTAGTSAQPTPPSAQEQVIFSFLHGDGNGPSSLIQDASGNLFGTAGGGGAEKAGNVFELSPLQGGGWSFTVLHSFGYEDGDGMNPGPVIMDAMGNLYGETFYGGTGALCAPVGCGTVFEVSPGGGGWTEKVLYSFQSEKSDGISPRGGLVFDGQGNLYGTTSQGGGGETAGGNVFELSPQSGGNWTETVLYTFSSSENNGYSPNGSLIFDGSGNLYGTTLYGGAAPCNYTDCGTVFELSPSGDVWTERVLHTFANSVGSGLGGPSDGVIFDATGNLYGVTPHGGKTSSFCAAGCGTVFELSPSSGGNWTKRDLYRFAGKPQDGDRPAGELVFDPAGNLWGATQVGGNHGGELFLNFCRDRMGAGRRTFDTTSKVATWTAIIPQAP